MSDETQPKVASHNKIEIPCANASHSQIENHNIYASQTEIENQYKYAATQPFWVIK
jgi:hypothetical protein